jgi:hypothetical protein
MQFITTMLFLRIELAQQCQRRGIDLLCPFQRKPVTDPVQHGVASDIGDVLQPRLVGHGPTLFAGLSKRVDLKLVGRLEFGSGAVAMRYEPTAGIDIDQSSI